MQIGNFKKLITSGKAVAIASAILVTPAVLTIVDQVSKRSNFLVRNITIALFLAAFVAFILAGLFSGILQDIILGVSIGLFVNALMTLSPVANAVGRITSKVKSG